MTSKVKTRVKMINEKTKLISARKARRRRIVQVTTVEEESEDVATIEHTLPNVDLSLELSGAEQPPNNSEYCES